MRTWVITGASTGIGRGIVEAVLALLCKIRSGLWESRVVPLVRERYRTHHLEPGNVREAQRRAHSRKSAG